jgi:GNAT superfamily N-acetyltransferase
MIIEPQKHVMDLREASNSDISIMAIHHRKMFEEIWERKKEHLEIRKANKIEKAYTLKLETELERGICKAWVIEDEGKIISSGAITIVSLVPNPSDLSFRVAYLHSMYTEKSHRNKKCAQRIIQYAIRHCKSLGIKRILLNASDAGQPVYQKFGFRSAPDTMRLFID